MRTVPQTDGKKKKSENKDQRLPHIYASCYFLKTSVKITNNKKYVMESPYKYPIDFSTTLLSAFDIGSCLMMRNIAQQLNGIQRDIDSLNNDQKILEEDYRKSSEKVLKYQENQK